MTEKGEVPEKHRWIQPGVVVDYHAVIDREVTRSGCLVRGGDQGVPFQTPSGSWVVFIKGMSGYVLCDALTPAGGDPIFPDGTFYSCTDPETLTHTEPEEALEEYFDNDMHPQMTSADVVALIRAHPVTVTAYRPTEISDKQVEAWADSCLEHLADAFHDEHGDPDAAAGDHFPKNAEKIMRGAVRAIIRRSHVWACEDVGSVTLTPDQIEKLMRAWRSDWFEEQT